MLPSVTCAVISATLLLVCILVSSSGTAGAATHTISWLAAGDSYASGAGLSRTASACRQGTGTSGHSATWAVVAAELLRSEESGTGLEPETPKLVACTGAVSDQFFHLDGSKKGQGVPEWNSKMHRFNLVTFSFGGDDIGFPNIVEACVLGNCPSDQDVRQKIQQLGTTGIDQGDIHIPSYPQFLTQVARSVVTKGGNILVMGYPELVEDPTLWPAGKTSCAGFSVSQADSMRGWAGDLNATIGYAVAQENAMAPNGVHFTFVDAVTGQPTSKSATSPSDPNLFEPTTGTRHELCSAGNEAWLNGFSELHPETKSFHPNQAGEDGMGQLAAEVIPKLTWPWTDAAIGGTQGVFPTSAPTTTATTTTPEVQATGVSVSGSMRTIMVFGPAQTVSQSGINQQSLHSCGTDISGGLVVKVTQQILNSSGDTQASGQLKIAEEFDGSGFDPGPLYFIMEYSSGPQCVTPGSGLATVQVELGPGKETDFTLWLVLGSATATSSAADLGEWTVLSPTIFLNGAAAPGDIFGSRVVECGGDAAGGGEALLVPVGTPPSSLSTGEECEPAPNPLADG